MASNSPTQQGSSNTPIFFPFFLVFTTIPCCNIVAAWSCLLFGPVFHSVCGKGQGWHFQALCSVSPFASKDCGVQFRISTFFGLTVYVSPLALFLSCSYIHKVFVRLYTVFHIVLLCNHFPILHLFFFSLPVFPGAPAGCWAWCPAICAGWHECLEGNLLCRPFFLLSVLAHINIITEELMGRKSN